MIETSVNMSAHHHMYNRGLEDDREREREFLLHPNVRYNQFSLIALFLIHLATTNPKTVGY